MNQKITFLMAFIFVGLFQPFSMQTIYAAADPELSAHTESPGITGYSSIVAIYFLKTPSVEQLAELRHNFFEMCTKLRHIVVPQITTPLSSFFTQLKRSTKIRLEEITDDISLKFVQDGDHKIEDSTIADCSCLIKKKYADYTPSIGQRVFSKIEHALTYLLFIGHLPI